LFAILRSGEDKWSGTSCATIDGGIMAVGAALVANYARTTDQLSMGIITSGTLVVIWSLAGLASLIALLAVVSVLEETSLASTCTLIVLQMDISIDDTGGTVSRVRSDTLGAGFMASDWSAFEW